MHHLEELHGGCGYNGPSEAEPKEPRLSFELEVDLTCPFGR